MREELTQTQAVTCVGPWLCREEFEEVADAIYGSDANWKTKQYGCDMLTIWKIRRQNETPATVLSTLIILKVQLKDHAITSNNNNNHTDDVTVLRNMYSNAFTRFLNFMSSIMQHKMVKTMYNTATELGIEHFLVDLRHLCAHGHGLPTLDIFRRSADYCMEWLKSYYWEPERKCMQNAVVGDIRLAKVIDFEQKIRELFSIYDAATEAQRNKFYYITDIKQNVLPRKSLETLHSYAGLIKKHKLSIIAPFVVNHLTEITYNSMIKIPESATLYCYHLFQCSYFIESSAKLFESNADECKETANFISIHQNVFRSLAICGFIRKCFDFLIKICENSHEPMERRKAASFWLKQISIGYQTFKAFKRICKDKKEKNSAFNIDMTKLNTEEMSPEIRAIFKNNLNVNCSNVLIFGDSIRRPWSLLFDRDYITERLINVNEYTCDIILRCLDFVQPQLNEKTKIEIKQMIQIAIGKNVIEDIKSIPYNETKYFTIDDIVGKHKENKENEMDLDLNHHDESVNKRYGIWSTVDEHINWPLIPIGQPI